MNIQIIAVGKIREKFIKEGVDEFLKRIQPYSSLKIIEIASEDIKNSSMVEKYLDAEAEKILSQIPDSAFVITLEIEGKLLASEEFAGKINAIIRNGCNQLVFVIGSAEGLSKQVKKRADFAISLSKMTLPYQIARLILLEQIYRAFKIIKNEPYHK